MRRLRLIASLALVGILGALPHMVVVLHAATTKFSDLFTNTGGTPEDLTVQTNHVTNTGASPFWAELVDSQGSRFLVAISADTMGVDTSLTSNRILWVVTPSSALASADYDVSGTNTTPQVEGQMDGDAACLWGRVTDSTHGYGLCIDASTDPQTLCIVEMNGANSGLSCFGGGGSFTYNVVAGDVYKLSFAGDTIKGYVNGVQRVCVVDATTTGTGQAGWGAGNFIGAGGDYASGAQWDAFLVEDSTGAVDDNCSASTKSPTFGFLGIF